jgi:hypothetical protein
VDRISYKSLRINIFNICVVNFMDIRVLSFSQVRGGFCEGTDIDVDSTGK